MAAGSDAGGSGSRVEWGWWPTGLVAQGHDGWVALDLRAA